MICSHTKRSSFFRWCNTWNFFVRKWKPLCLSSFLFNKPGLDRSSGDFFLYRCDFNVSHIPAWSALKNRWNQNCLLGEHSMCSQQHTVKYKFRTVKKRSANSPQQAGSWWDVVIEFVDDPLEWSVTLNFVFWKVFFFYILQKGILNISSWFYYYFFLTGALLELKNFSATVYLFFVYALFHRYNMLTSFLLSRQIWLLCSINAPSSFDEHLTNVALNCLDFFPYLLLTFSLPLFEDAALILFYILNRFVIKNNATFNISLSH